MNEISNIHTLQWDRIQNKTIKGLSKKHLNINRI